MSLQLFTCMITFRISPQPIPSKLLEEVCASYRNMKRACQRLSHTVVHALE